MQVQFGLANFAPEWREAVVCIGTFDGVHLGHREVIRKAVGLGREMGAPCCLITFDRHPAATLKPEACPPAIASLEGRLARFQELGVALTVVLPFDFEFSETPAEAFLNDVLIGRFKAKQLVVGHDFAMGKARQGDAEWLRARIATEIVQPYERLGIRISSSLVRKKVLSGDLEEVELLLGRPFEIEGVVISGDRLGRQIGFPTANLARTFLQASPPDGVYAGSMEVRGTDYLAAVSIGTRPSVGGVDRRIESYLLDYDGPEFYGDSCVLKLWRRVRPQETYESMEALISQIGLDVEWVKRYGEERGVLRSVNR